VVNDDVWENKLAVSRERVLILMNINQESCMKASSGNLKLGIHFSILLMTQATVFLDSRSKDLTDTDLIANSLLNKMWKSPNVI
jgi:hypothetical protein